MKKLQPEFDFKVTKLTPPNPKPKFYPRRIKVLKGQIDAFPETEVRKEGRRKR